MPYGSDQNPLRISLDDESYLVLTADGIKVPAVDFVSPAGGLIPGGSPFPFELSVASHTRQVTLGTWGGSVVVDGSVTLDIQWNSEIDINDLSVEYGTANAEVLTAIIELPLLGEDETIVDNSEMLSPTSNDDFNDLAEFDMS